MSQDTSPGRAVGIELCSSLVRGVLLGPAGADIAHASEVALNDQHDDRSVLDALTRLRADLGAAAVPARVAMFPTGSSMRRLDVTGSTGPELNEMRSEINRRHHVASTMLVDDGPRRWMFVLHWPNANIRRIEALAERAGFIDVAVEPSPIALGRVLDTEWSLAQRVAAAGEATAIVLRDGVPVAAVSADATGRTPPLLLLDRGPVSFELFDDVVSSDELEQLVDGACRRAAASADDATAAARNGITLIVDSQKLPSFPPHDLRSPARQCVAIGAAVGAAGLAGRIRPVDIIDDSPASSAAHHRPWVVERVTTVAPVANSGPKAARRALARLVPSRRRR